MNSEEADRKRWRRHRPGVVLLGLLLCLLAAAGGVTLMSSRRLRVGNFPAVSAGMTQREVETILGGPPGDYGSPLPQWARMTLEGFEGPPGSICRYWRDDDNQFEIYFDRNGRVAAKHRRSGYSQQGLWDALRERAGLPSTH